MAEYLTLAKVDEGKAHPVGAGTKPSAEHTLGRLGMQSLSLAIVVTSMFNTREKRSGPRGSPCWTPDSDVRDPMECHNSGCLP